MEKSIKRKSLKEQIGLLFLMLGIAFAIFSLTGFIYYRNIAGIFSSLLLKYGIYNQYIDNTLYFITSFKDGFSILPLALGLLYIVIYIILSPISKKIKTLSIIIDIVLIFLIFVRAFLAAGLEISFILDNMIGNIAVIIVTVINLLQMFVECIFKMLLVPFIILLTIKSKLPKTSKIVVLITVLLTIFIAYICQLVDHIMLFEFLNFFKIGDSGIIHIYPHEVPLVLRRYSFESYFTAVCYLRPISNILIQLSLISTLVLVFINSVKETLKIRKWIIIPYVLLPSGVILFKVFISTINVIIYILLRIISYINF